MASTNDVKCLLLVDEDKYKLLMASETQFLTADAVKAHVAESRQDLVQLGILDPTRFTLEILDNDFEEYIKLDSGSVINHMARLRARRVATCDEGHSKCCDESPTVVMNSLLNDLNDMRLGNNQVVGGKADVPIADVRHSQMPATTSNESGSSDTDAQGPTVVPGGIDEKTASILRILNYNEKKQFVEMILKKTRTLKTCDAKQLNTVWKKISHDLNSDNVKMPLFSSPAKCRAAFSGLASQYIYVLKNLKSATIEDIRSIWPFFEAFHLHLNWSLFQSLTSLNVAKVMTYRSQFGSNNGADFNTTVAVNDISNDGFLPKGLYCPNLCFLSMSDVREKCHLVGSVASNFDLFRGVSQEKGWNAVVRSMRDYYTKDCNNGSCAVDVHLFQSIFKQLLRQYSFCLVNFHSADAAQAEWPLFHQFYAFEFEDICERSDRDNIKAAKIKFASRITQPRDGHKEDNRNIAVGKNEERLGDDTCDHSLTPSEASDSSPESGADEQSKINVLLIQSVKNQMNECCKETMSIEDFWQRIAYKLGRFENPINDEVKFMWRRRFYRLIKKYDHASRSEHSNWQYLKAMNSIDLQLFRDDGLNSSNTSSKPLELHKKRTARRTKGKAIPEWYDYDPASGEDDNMEETMRQGLPVEDEDESLTKQMKVISAIRNHMEDFQDPELREETWNAVRNDVMDTVHEAKSGDTFFYYLKCILDTYKHVLETAQSINDATQRWPLFRELSDIDLRPLLGDQKATTYTKLRRKLNKQPTH